MKLLKSFGGDEVEMKVVSLLDSTSSMVSARAPLVANNGWGEVIRWPLELSGPLFPTCIMWQGHLTPSPGLFCSAPSELLALGQR